MDNSNLASSSKSKLVCVDLGCGTHKAESFIGVDVVATDSVDVIADLNKNFPFPDNSVDVIHAHNILQHLPDKIHAMNEIWRICKPNARVDITITSRTSNEDRPSYEDTHEHFCSLNSFIHYCQEFPLNLTQCQNFYGFKGEFSLIANEQWQSEQYISTHAVLKVIKPEENCYQLNLRNTNFIIFPDWSQSIEVIFEECVRLFQVIIKHPNSQNISLIINTPNTKLEEAQFLLADVLLDICYTQSIDNDSSPEFNLLTVNSVKEYKGIIPTLDSIIGLKYEDKEFINQLGLLEITPFHTLEKVISESLEINRSHIPIYEKSQNINNNIVVRPNPSNDNPLWQYFCKNQGRLIHKWHHYFDIYHNHFSRFIGLPVKILEIGVSHGGSLQMWKEYFGKEAYIYGIDIDSRCQKLEEDRVKIFIGSQTDKNFLQYVKEQIGTIDIIIDDGGHTMEQQICSFEELYSALKETGVYLVEDLHTSYWPVYGGGCKKTGTFIEYAKNFIDQIHAWHSQEEGYAPSSLTKTCTGIHFYDSVLVIEKYPNYDKPKSSMTGKFSF